MPVALVHTCVRVRDIDASIRFYEALGFERRGKLQFETAYNVYVVKQGLWRFGLHPEQVAGFLAEYGWREREQVGPDEYADCYLEPSGRTLTASEIERAVYAQR